MSRFVAPLATLGLVLGLVAATAGPASAHTGTLGVHADCLPDGTYKLTYSGQTSNVPATGSGHTATLTVGEIQPAGATATPPSQTVVGNTTYSFTVTVPGTTTYAQATAFLHWGDGANSDPQGTIQLAGNCKRHVPIPATPFKTDPCGPNNASWVVPTDTDVLHWALTNGHLVVSIKILNTLFSDNTTTHDFGGVTDSGEACPTTQIEIPAVPSQTDSCGLGNAAWVVPADTDVLDWTLQPNGHLTVTIKTPNTVFTDGTTTHDYGVVVDSGVLCQVTSLAPKKANPCGWKHDRYWIPSQADAYITHVGVVQTPGWHKTNGAMRINLRAHATDPVNKMLIGQVAWHFKFPFKKCNPPGLPPGTGERNLVNSGPFGRLEHGVR